MTTPNQTSVIATGTMDLVAHVTQGPVVLHIADRADQPMTVPVGRVTRGREDHSITVRAGLNIVGLVVRDIAVPADRPTVGPVVPLTMAPAGRVIRDPVDRVIPALAAPVKAVRAFARSAAAVTLDSSVNICGTSGHGRTYPHASRNDRTR